MTFLERINARLMELSLRLYFKEYRLSEPKQILTAVIIDRDRQVTAFDTEGKPIDMFEGHSFDVWPKIVRWINENPERTVEIHTGARSVKFRKDSEE